MGGIMRIYFDQEREPKSTRTIWQRVHLYTNYTAFLSNGFIALNSDSLEQLSSSMSKSFCRPSQNLADVPK